MYIWEIVLAFGAVGSLVMWLKDIFYNNRSVKELIYPALTIVLAVASVFLYSQNTKFLDPIEQGQKFYQHLGLIQLTTVNFIRLSLKVLFKLDLSISKHIKPFIPTHMKEY